MELGIAGVVRDARRLAEARMESEATVTRIVAGGDRDPETGTVAAPSTDIIYEGPCRVRMASAAAAVIADGGAQLAMQQTSAHFPAGTVLAVGDRITVTASDNDRLTGLVMIVRALAAGSQASAARYGVEIVT